MDTAETKAEGFKPAFTWEELEEASRAMALRYRNTLKNHFRTKEQIDGVVEELASEFISGACDALKKAEAGKAIRSLQWSYGKGYMLNHYKAIMETLYGKDKSLSDTVARDDDGEIESTLADVMEQEKEMDPAEAVCESDAGPSAIDYLAELDERAALIVRRHIIDGKTFAEIAGELGLSIAYVQQIEQKGLDTLRRKMKAA